MKPKKKYFCMQDGIHLDVWRKLWFPSLKSNDSYGEKILQNY